MKTLFSIMLIFLFISCGGGSKAPVDDDSAAVVPDGDEDVMDDEEFVDDEDDDDEPDTKPDKDSDKPENDEDADSDPCDPNPCTAMGMGGSTGICRVEANGKYSCECKENYEWDGKRYCTGKTRTEECTGLPEHGYWVLDKSSITQQWRGSDEGWWPDAVGKYSWRIPYESSCYFRCKKTYFWNGEDCVNLCDAEPCKDVPHSDGVCSSVGAALYTCGCEEGYYWWGERLGCIARKPALGNICAGQNECYDDYYEIECPTDPDADFFGQEAHYAKLGVCSPLDITLDNSNAEEPLIINRNTGLMWQKNIEEANFSWEEADSHCEELVYAGYDDWRLPSVHELMSIVVSNKYQYDYNMIFFRYFKELEFDYLHDETMFWTSDKGFKINLHENMVRKSSDMSGCMHTAICVRGEKLPGPEFEVSEINGDKVVTELTTGIMWQKSMEGKVRWENALYKCEHLVYAGYSDWRLPLRNELLSLMNYEKSTPASDYPGMEISSKDSIVFSGTNNGFKIHDTVDIFGKESYLACSADFSDGTISPASKYMDPKYIQYYDFPLYCVRSDVCPAGKFLRGLECLDDPCGSASCEVENSTGVCVPKTESAYECQCLEGFFWNGSKCVNPCDADPCSKIVNSDKNCTAVNADLYYCGCVEGYTWENGKCDTFATNVRTVGSICTGLDKCYSTEEEIECSGSKSKPFAGQDAFYASMGKCAQHDYSIKTAADQNIIVDNNTKLEWQQTYPQKVLPWNEAYAYCDSLEYGGKSDWRLPAPHEMMTIVDEAYDYPMLDQTYFTDIPGVHPGRSFWTDDVKIINFYSDGWVYSYPSKDDIYFVMCVRGKKLPKARLEVSTVGNDKIAKDSSTGLAWTLRDHSADEWEEALSYCMNLTYAGKTGWRLPNKNELVSLVNFGEAAPIEFYDIWTDCWSSTSSTGNAAMVSLNGNLEYVGKTDRGYAVICVGNFE
jgi:hypothetical protein